MKNWKHIGEVTVIDFRRNKKTYPSLKAAVLDTREWTIKSLKYDRLAYRTIHDFDRNKDRFYSGEHAYYDWKTRESFSLWGGGDPLIFIDELGMIIPSWKVKETYNNLENYTQYKWKFYGYKRRGRICDYYRYPKTLQEMRENQAFLCDEDVKEYNIKMRRRRLNLPTAWDDVSRKDIRNHSWKRHRRHQWKSK